MTRTTAAGRKGPQKPSGTPAGGRKPRQPNPPAKPGEPGEPGEPGAVCGPTRVRAGSPAAMLAIIPYLLGFAPEDSLVIIGIEPPKGEIKISMRYDLPAGPDPDPELVKDIAGHAVAVLGSQQVTGAIVVGYGPDPRVRPLIDALGSAAVPHGIELTECLRFHDGRYWSYTCRNERCCPATGVPVQPDQHPAAVALAAAERRVLPARGALAATIAPIGGIAADSMREATRRAERHVTQVLARVRKSHRIGAAQHMIASEGLAAVSRLVKAYRAGERYKTEYELAWLTVALRDLRVRDDAWARMDPRFSAEHRRLWTDVVRRAQPGYVAAPASLLAFVAWQGGDGALANVALDRALSDDREYSMAGLLRDVIAAGAPPEMAILPMTPEEVAAEYEAMLSVPPVPPEKEREEAQAAGAAPVPAMTGQATLS